MILILHADSSSSDSPASSSSLTQDVASPQTPLNLVDIKTESYTDMDKSTMIAVIQFLKRGNLKVSKDKELLVPLMHNTYCSSFRLNCMLHSFLNFSFLKDVFIEHLFPYKNESMQLEISLFECFCSFTDHELLK